MTDGDTQAKNLLQLELDGRANLSDLVLEVLSVRDGGGELASYNDASTLRSEFLCRSCMHTLGETGTKQTGDLLDESLRGKESVVLLCELLDELLVLVEPFITISVFILNFFRHDIHFFKSSTDMYSRSICLARSISLASARMQMDMRGRGTLGSLHRELVQHR